MLQPFDEKTKLAPTPQKDPKYSVSVQSKTLGELKLADPRATRALVSLMDMGAVLGGAASHYGGPAAFAELMSALHGFVFGQSRKTGQAWYQMFNLVNDAGHCENGLYALKANYGFAGLALEDLKKFRSIESYLTGHGESHLWPQGVQLSNGPLGSAFPQSQGLAMGDAHAGRKRVTVTAISDGACMEGEAKEAMAAIPGLAKRGKVASFILIISDNNTKLSGRIDKDSFSMEPTFHSMSALGWKVIKLEKGHDLEACLHAIEDAYQMVLANPYVPVAIHAKTVKGIGNKKVADSSSGGHGFPLKACSELPEFLKEIYDGGEIPSEFQGWITELCEVEKEMKAKAVKPTQPEEKIQVGIANAMIRARKENLPVVSITSDLPGSTGVAAFGKEFPNEYFDVGVAESNMISAAAGMSKVGYIPVVDTFAQFGVTKGALPLTMASLSDCPLIAVFSHTGFQDAADGASHQALSWSAMTASIPHLHTVALSCSEEADSLMYQAIKKIETAKKLGQKTDSYIFFLGRENFPKNFASVKYELGRPQNLKDTTSEFSQKTVALVAVGSMVPQALKAAETLAAQKVGSIVVNASSINHLDFEAYQSIFNKTGHRVVTVEDHQYVGGFTSMLSQEFAARSVSLKLQALAVKGEFGQSAYNAIELYKKHGMDSDSIVRAALKLNS
ncbi:MAG: transketolase C-terminal domain-containing protein [Pseudobdellovibrionaceae bacterium]